MHTKRETVNKSWPIPRKGTKYIVVPSHSKKSGIPILIILRDLLKFVKTRKELEKLILEKKILVNNKVIFNANYSLLLFDTISLPSIKKYFLLNYTHNGKITVNEINENESKEKVSKVINKKVLKGRKIQLNLQDGRNILAKENVRIGDSVLINFEKKFIEKILPIKEKSKILVIKGKHMGKTGLISKIEGKELQVKIDDKNLMIKENEVIVTK